MRGSHAPPPVHCPLLQLCGGGQSCAWQHWLGQTHRLPCGTHGAVQLTVHCPEGVQAGAPWFGVGHGKQVNDW